MLFPIAYPKPEVAVITVTVKVFGVSPDTLGIREQVQELLREKKVQHFVLDLQHVDWMNSSGLGLLISLLKYIRDADCTLALLCVSGKVEGILLNTKLDKVLQSYPTLDMYLEALHTQPAR
ncbi:MAG: anti-sigma factor antagonist [Patescibacteria group bacterium]|jgi:anti-anti-sigma factor